MQFAEIVAFLISTLAAAALTRITMVYALKRGLLDTPNARSSHTLPTPRGGGLAIVLTASFGAAALCLSGLVEIRIAAVLIIAGAMIAIVGYVDDKRGLPALPRFAVHIASSVLVVFALLSDNGTQPFGGFLEWSIALLLVVGTAWSINLFNFMDGIDGIAGSQAMFVTIASAALVFPHEETGLVALLLVTTGACLGFLIWNWPPARIFMGDVGSGFLGFWLAAMALLLHAEGSLSIWVSIVLGSLFISDATTTLIRRAASGKRWYEAHRSHAYQHLARRWQSHAKVTCLLWVLNLLVVLPLAGLAVLMPTIAPAVSVGTVLGFSVVAWLAGAGKEQAK